MTKNLGRLEGKSVIITGAGSGIGRAASLLFTKEGAKLIAVDRTDGVNETAKLVRDAGGTVEAVTADAGSESDVKAFIEKAVSKYGKLDAIWANAGVSGDTATGGTKPAIVETGAQVMVPLFITIGEKIKIDTRSDSYLGRES